MTLFRRGWWGRLVPLLAVLALCSCLGERGRSGTAAAGEAPLPELRVESAPELAAAAEGVRRVDRSRLAAAMRLTGLSDPGGPIHVVLVPEDSPAATETPSWVAGYADSSADLIVLFPERSPSYPDASVSELVGHEVTHVLIDRAAGGEPVPRWFHEGLAMVAGGAWGLGDSTRVTLALLLDRERSLADVDAAFASGDAGRVGRAYAVAGAFVRDLLTRRGSDAGARILAGMADGLDFDTAFVRATGSTRAMVERVFWRRSDRWYRWIPVLTSTLAVWAGIVLVATWAYRRRRARAATIRARWEREDGPSPPEIRG